MFTRAFLHLVPLLCLRIGHSVSAQPSGSPPPPTFNPQSNWTWIAGFDRPNQSGVYGLQYQPSNTVIPGARHLHTMSIQSTADGDLIYVFGGYGFVAGSDGDLNDMFMWNSTSLSWTWLSGNQTGNVAGNFGALGIPAVTNFPGAREGAASSIHPQTGAFYLFGGYCYSPSPFFLNDLWEWNSLTALWTWAGGSAGKNALGVYGLSGTIGSRYLHSMVLTVNGFDATLYIFGGHGYGQCN